MIAKVNEVVSSFRNLSDQQMAEVRSEEQE
jgi:hypothetical protein